MIDPDVIEAQRRALSRPTEVKCAKCGRRTRDATGVCRACKGVNLPNFRAMDSEQLLGLYENVRAEIQRRRDALTTALGV